MAAMGVVALALAACGGGGGGGGGGSSPPPPPPTQYTIGGTVTGLSGTVVLQDNGGDNLSVTQNGSFTFATKVNSGAAYAVTVLTQPAGQTCTVASGSGTASANVTNVAVSCASSSSGVTIGGTVTGLTGTGLVLLDNGGDSLPVAQNGTFTFATALAAGTAYAVTVGTQPGSPTQSCTVTNGTGTTASTNITNVAVNCAGVGKFAYTASNALGTIYAYTIDPTTGALTQVGSPYPDGTHPAAVSLAPNGKFAFSASDSGTKIHAFTIDQTTGALTEVAGSPFPVTGFTVGSTNPDIAVDPASAHLYLASAGDAKVAGFAIDPTSGALAAIAGSPYTAGTNAGGIPAFSPDGKYLYVVNQNATGGTVSGYSIDSTTGALTALTGSPFATGSNPYWIAFTPDGKFAYVSNAGDNTISAYSVAAGVLTALPTPAPADGSPEDLTIDSAGAHLYAPVSSGTSPGAVDVFTINADGTLTKVTGSPYPVGIGPRFVNIDPTGRFAYVSSAGTGGTGVYGFSIDATTGALTALANSPYDTGANSWPQFITIDPSGKFGYTANQNTGTISEFTIDQTSGVLTPIAGSPLTTGAKPFFVSISPEAPGIRD